MDKRPLLTVPTVPYFSFDSVDNSPTMGNPSESIDSASGHPEPEKDFGGDKNFFQRSARDGTFENDTSEVFYEPIAEYEGRHRYDPSFEWDPKEEKRIVRKVCLIRSRRSMHVDWSFRY
jgi:hypothetical protein